MSILSQRHERKKTLPPKPGISAPTCITDNYSGKGMTILGGNVNPPIRFADISTDANFATFYLKDMTGSISVAGLSGFLSYPDEVVRCY